MGSIFSPEHFSVIARRGSTTKFPENTLPALQEALDVDGANAIEVDLSLTRDGKVVLLQDRGTNNSVNIRNSSFQEFMVWAIKQDKLKLVLLKLKVPENEIHRASVMLKDMQKVLHSMSSAPRFEIVVSTPRKEVLNRVRETFNEFQFSFEREIPSAGVINYHRFTTVPTAMQYKNIYTSLGFPTRPTNPEEPDAWLIYKFILTLDFKIRDNYQKSSSHYVKIISWTFNDEKKMRCLINLGVDGIVTDNPKLLRRIALDMGKNLD